VTFSRAFFVMAALATLWPQVQPALALACGVAFAVLFGNPLVSHTKTLQSWLLQASVVGLGAQIPLDSVLRAGASGFWKTLTGLSVALLLAFFWARILKTEARVSALIGVGTAICGGSAIAAVSPVIGAKSHETSVALAVIFLLNSMALFLFPPLGQALHLSPEQFGVWCALAIHDTSSVVGAAAHFGDASLALATTVKLARALWIVPLTLVVPFVWRQSDKTVSAKRPWFILGFLAMSAAVTWVPEFRTTGAVIYVMARRGLVMTLFLVGAQMSREALSRVGLRPFLLGVLLWVCMVLFSLGLVSWNGP
jgi:uncharacterized integral membrane protein (TIGR00698 family)